MLFLRRTARGAINRPTLICFPPSGGLGAGFLPWAEHLTAYNSVVGIDIAGRGVAHRRPPLRSMEDLVSWIAQELTCDLDGCVFYGHSFGAVVAFETIRYFENTLQSRPLRLVVGASSAPCKIRERVIPKNEEELVAFLVKLGGTDQAVLSSWEMRKIFLPPVQSDLGILSDYLMPPSAKIGCDIAAISGANDPLVAPEEMFHWKRRTTARFRAEKIEGGHFFTRENSSEFFALLNSLAFDQ